MTGLFTLPVYQDLDDDGFIRVKPKTRHSFPADHPVLCLSKILPKKNENKHKNRYQELWTEDDEAVDEKEDAEITLVLDGTPVNPGLSSFMEEEKYVTMTTQPDAESLTSSWKSDETKIDVLVGCVSSPPGDKIDQGFYVEQPLVVSEEIHDDFKVSVKLQDSMTKESGALDIVMEAIVESNIDILDDKIAHGSGDPNAKVREVEPLAMNKNSADYKVTIKDLNSMDDKLGVGIILEDIPFQMMVKKVDCAYLTKDPFQDKPDMMTPDDIELDLKQEVNLDQDSMDEDSVGGSMVSVLHDGALVPPSSSCPDMIMDQNENIKMMIKMTMMDQADGGFASMVDSSDTKSNVTFVDGSLARSSSSKNNPNEASTTRTTKQKKIKVRWSLRVALRMLLERGLVLMLMSVYSCWKLPQYADAGNSAGCAAGTSYFGSKAVTPQCGDGYNDIVGAFCYAPCPSRFFGYSQGGGVTVTFSPGPGPNAGTCYQDCPNRWGDTWRNFGWSDDNDFYNCNRGGSYGRCDLITGVPFTSMGIYNYAWGKCYNCAPFYRARDNYYCDTSCGFGYDGSYDMSDVGNNKCYKRAASRPSYPKGCNTTQSNGCCINYNSVPLTDGNIKNAALYWRDYKTEAEILFGPIQNWDVSRVTNLDDVFKGFTNIPFDSSITLNLWNVASVTSMSGTFYNANLFNMDISQWNVAKVTSMYQTFQGATRFDKNLNSLNVANVRNMAGMFLGASSFRSTLFLWNVAKVTNFSSMFCNASLFNGDISTWSTGSAATMENMFWGASSFQGNLSKWDTRSVTSMRNMFNSATKFNSELYTWDTGRVTSFSYMFYYATAFNKRLCWDTSKMNPTDNAIFLGSLGSFENPTCRGLQLLAQGIPVNLLPQLSNSFTKPNKYDGFVPSLKMSGQGRYIFSLPDFSNSTDGSKYVVWTMNSQILIQFNFTVSNVVAKRHSICLLENVTQLSLYCSNMTKCSYCFDIGGTDIQSSFGATIGLGKSIQFSFKPLDMSQNIGLFGKTINHWAFINDYSGSNTNQSTIFSLISWIQYQPLNIISSSFTELAVSFVNRSSSANITFFNTTWYKVPNSYTQVFIKSSVVGRTVLTSDEGFKISLLESGVRYYLILKPSYEDGTLIPGQDSNTFSSYAVVQCTCAVDASQDKTGMPSGLVVSQNNGYITMVFTDNSVCEEAYAMYRLYQNKRYIFAPNYYFYSTSKCGNLLSPGTTYGDDLSASRLDVGNTYAYCVEAIATDYMANSLNLFSPNRMSSEANCQNIRIAWEASIKGSVTSKADTGSIPIENVNVEWKLMDPFNINNPLSCTNTLSICSGFFLTDSSGSFSAKFFVDEPQFGFTQATPVPILLTFSRSLDGKHNDTFLANQETTDITISGLIVYLRHLQFDAPLLIVDASTMAFTGTVFVRGTAYGSYYGCPVQEVKVCASQNKPSTAGGNLVTMLLACGNTMADGTFNLPLPIGAVVNNVTLTYKGHEFSPALSNKFAELYKSGIQIESLQDYSKNDFVDMTITSVNVDVVGGLCNKTLGTASIKYRILGCNWIGRSLQQTSHFATHFVPAHVIQFSDVTITDSRNSPVTIVNNYFSNLQKTVDLRNYVDASGGTAGLDSDNAGDQLGLSSPPARSQDIQYIRFQYDGTLSLGLKLLSADSIGDSCRNECQNVHSPYFNACHSIHVIDTMSIVTLDVPVFFDILPGIRCELVEEGTTVILENHLGYENVPQFTKSDFYTNLNEDEKAMLLKCYPSCINNVTVSDDGQSQSGAGLHNFSLYAGRSEIMKPFSKKLIVKVNGYSSGGEFQSSTHVAIFIIQGMYKDGNGLSFAFPTHTPVMILRDPPGGLSYARYENIQTMLTLNSFESTSSGKKQMGFGVESVKGVKGSDCIIAPGVGKCVDSVVEVRNSLVKGDISWGGITSYWRSDIQKSRSATWTYQTSTDPWLAGSMSDIFVVPNLDVKYQPVKIVMWKSNSCAVDQLCDTNGGNCQLPVNIVFDLKSESTKEALSFFSRYHIENVKMPELLSSLEAVRKKLIAIDSNIPVCGSNFNNPCNATDRKKTIKDITMLSIGIGGWNDTLQMEAQILTDTSLNDWGCFNESDRDSCLATPIIPQYINSNAGILSSVEKLFQNSGIDVSNEEKKRSLLRNINRVQFSGGGSQMSMKMSWDLSSHSTHNVPLWDVLGYLNKLDVGGDYNKGIAKSLIFATKFTAKSLMGLKKLGNALDFLDLLQQPETVELTTEATRAGFETEIFGFGFAGYVDVTPKATMSYRYLDKATDGTTVSSSISFVLGDNDPQDEFVVDLFVDKQFGGIIFKTSGGRSKCPHEKGTAAVEVPFIEIAEFPPSKVAANDDLLFYVDVANKGVGISLFSFHASLSRDNDGLVISVDGINLGSTLEIASIGSFNNQNPEKYRKLVRIKRGPRQMIHHSLYLSWESSCEYSNRLVNDLTAASFPDVTAAVTVELYNVMNNNGEKYMQWIDDCPSIEWAGSVKVNNGFLVTSEDEPRFLSISIFNPGYKLNALRNHSRLQTTSSGVFLLYRLLGTQKWTRAQMFVNMTSMETKEANFVSAYVLEDTFGYISVNWVISYAFLQDGKYEIIARVICDNAWGTPDENQIPSVVGVIDRSRPGRYGSPLPIDNFVNVGQEISLLFTKPLLCFPIPFNINVLVGKDVSLSNEQLLIDCHDNKIGFVVDLTKVPISKLAGQSFTVEIGRIYTNTAAVRDINGNPMDPNKGNIRFQKSFLPLGADAQVSFVLSASLGNSSVCSSCSNATIPVQNCTILQMKQYQESIIRTRLSLMMTLNATDRVSVSNIDCVSKTITGTVTFTNPPKPTPLPTAMPSFAPTRSAKPSRRPTIKPSKRPSFRPSLKPLSKKPTMNPSVVRSSKPSTKPTAPTAEPTKIPTGSPTSMPTHTQLRSTSGLIYNKGSGKCLSFYDYGFYSLVMMEECNVLSQNQQWSSYKSTRYDAFSLGTFTDMKLVMDSYTDYYMVEYSYINLVLNSDSDKALWIYDDSFRILPYLNRSLCTTVQVYDQWYSVELLPCSSDVYNYFQIWNEFSLYGGSNGPTFSYLICPPGEKAIKIAGRAGGWINLVTMTCDGGTVLGPVGSNSGGNRVVGVSCPKGYTGVTITSGSYVGQLSLICTDSSGSISFGKASGSYGSGSVDEVICRGNEKIIGLYSRYGDYVDSINFICGPVLTNPTAQPTLIPTIAPTSSPTKEPSVKPSSQPTSKPTSRPTKTPSRMPSIPRPRGPSRRPSRKPSSSKPTSEPTSRPIPKTSPTKRPSVKATSKPITRPTKTPSRMPSIPRPRGPSRRPSRKPSSRPAGGRRLQVINKSSEQESYMSTDLLMDLLQTMTVSDDIHYHGRHLRLLKASSPNHLLTDIRISDIVITSRNSSSISSNQGTHRHDDDAEKNKWVMFSSNSSAFHRYSGDSSLNMFNNEVPISRDDRLHHLKDELGKHVSHEISKLKDDVEEKLDRISRLLERVLDL